MNNKETTESQKLVHKTFEITLFLKAIDAILEGITGALMFFLKPEVINQFVILFTQKELSEDPKDVVANFLLKIAQNVSISSLLFISIYLISHAVIKIVLIVALWKRKIWAYPTSMVVFLGFAVYQMYKYSHSHSLYLIYLTILDVLLIILTWLEYKRLKYEFFPIHNQKN